jgi:hypothetical protein
MNYFYRFFHLAKNIKKIFEIYLNFTMNLMKLVYTICSKRIPSFRLQIIADLLYRDLQI